MSILMKLVLAAGVASALKVGSEQIVEAADTDNLKIEVRAALYADSEEKVKQIQDDIPAIKGVPGPLQYYTYGQLGAVKVLFDVNLGQLPADGKLGLAPATGKQNGQEFVIIHHVLPDSHSAKHGLEMFTRAFVVAINHQRVRDHNSYFAMRDALQPGQEVVYTLCPSIDGYRADYLPAEAHSAAEQPQPAASEMKVDWQPPSTWKFILELTNMMDMPNDQEVLDFIRKLEMERVTDTEIVFQRWKSFFAAHGKHVRECRLKDLVVDYQAGIGMIQKGGESYDRYGHMILPTADTTFDDETLAYYKSVASPWVFDLWQSYKCDVPDSKISGDDDLATEDQKSESNAVPLQIQVSLISGETHVIECLSTDTVKTTKNKIRAAAHIAENMKVDLFDPDQAKMADELTLAECGVVDGAEVSAVVSEKFHPQPGPDDLYAGEGMKHMAVVARCPGCKHVDLRYHLGQADSMFEKVGNSNKCRCNPPIIRCNHCQEEFVYESGNDLRIFDVGCPMLNGVELKKEYVLNLDCWKEKYPSAEDEPKPRQEKCNIQ